MMPAFWFSLLLLLWFSSAQAGEWAMVSHEPGLTLYTRTVQGQDLKDFRGVLRVKASMREVAEALVDVDSMPQWFFNMSEARVLKIDDPQSSFIYFVIKGMGPVGDRDAVVKMTIEQNPQTLVLSMSGSAAPELYPSMPGRVRIPRLQSGWTVTPISATETEIRLHGNADPGGRIPVWVANLVVIVLPEKTLQSLRERLETSHAKPAVPSRDPRVLRLLAGVKFPEFPE